VDTVDDLADLSTREMQAFGALCLQRFSKAKGIKHPYIDELIQHLLSILILNPLDSWEREGAVLELSGRGDPLPDALKTQLGEDVRPDFARLVEFVVEIGFVDLYGATSKRPLHFLLRSLAILDDHGIERPQVNELFNDRTSRGKTTPEWGEIYSKERYEQVREVFK
jgi:hypothetical protein